MQLKKLQSWNNEVRNIHYERTKISSLLRSNTFLRFVGSVRAFIFVVGQSKFHTFLVQEEKKRELKALEEQLRKAQSVLQLDELSHRKRLLRRLEYSDKSDIITEKVCSFFNLIYLTINP